MVQSSHMYLLSLKTRIQEANETQFLCPILGWTQKKPNELTRVELQTFVSQNVSFHASFGLFYSITWPSNF